MIIQSDLKCRADLAHLCNERKLFQAVEVGTDCGDFAFESRVGDLVTLEH
jgi:hypothetical protein